MNLKLKIPSMLVGFFMGVTFVFNAEASNTPLHNAVKLGNAHAVKVLCETHPFWVNEKDEMLFTPAYYAVQGGNLNIIKCLISHGADANIFLSVAVREGKIGLVKYLTKHYSLDLNGAMSGAVIGRNKEIVKYLVECGANACVGLSEAAILGITDMVEYFVEVFNVNPEFGLYNAASNGNLEIVKYLLEHGAYINAWDSNGRRALHYAHDSKMVKYLVENGASINLRDNYGRTPLAVVKSRWDFAQLLVSPVDRNDDLIEMMRYLVANGATL